MRPFLGAPLKRAQGRGWASSPSVESPDCRASVDQAAAGHAGDWRTVLRGPVLAGASCPVRQSAPRPRDVGRRDGSRPLRRALGPDVPRSERLVSARIGHRGARGRLPAAHLHGLPRLRARLVPAVQARERVAGHRPRVGGLLAVPELAAQPCGPSRDRRGPRTARRRRRVHAHRRRVPRAAMAATARISSLPQSARDVRPRADLGDVRPAAPGVPLHEATASAAGSSPRTSPS